MNNKRLVVLFMCEICYEVMADYRATDHSGSKHQGKATFIRELGPREKHVSAKLKDHPTIIKQAEFPPCASCNWKKFAHDRASSYYSQTCGDYSPLLEKSK